MKNSIKRYLSLILCIIIFASLISVQAFAIDPIDKSKEVTLTVTYTNDKDAIPNAEFDLYYVADGNEFADYTIIKKFAACGIDFSDTYAEGFWESATKALAEYATENGIAPTSTALTDSKGEIHFTGIPQGLYLVVGKTVKTDTKIYNSLPFLVSLPTRDDNDEWHYDVTASPKPGEIIDVPVPTPPVDPNLPQTGLLWWPVPVLLFVGLCFIAAGLTGRKAKYDA